MHIAVWIVALVLAPGAFANLIAPVLLSIASPEDNVRELVFEDFDNSLGSLTGVWFRLSANVGQSMLNPTGATVQVGGSSTLIMSATDRPAQGPEDFMMARNSCIKTTGLQSFDVVCGTYFAWMADADLLKYTNGGNWNMSVSGFFDNLAYYGPVQFGPSIFRDFNWDIEYEYQLAPWVLADAVLADPNPEPSFYWLVGLVLAGMVLWKRRASAHSA